MYGGLACNLLNTLDKFKLDKENIWENIKYKGDQPGARHGHSCIY